MFRRASFAARGAAGRARRRLVLGCEALEERVVPDAGGAVASQALVSSLPAQGLPALEATFTQVVSQVETQLNALLTQVSSLVAQETQLLAAFTAQETALLGFINSLEHGILPGSPPGNSSGGGNPPPTSPPPGPSPTGNPSSLITLNLDALDVKLLGLVVQTDPIQVVISAQSGNGQLLGNLLGDVSGLLNLQGVNNALNTVLNSVITLANSSSLSVSGINTATGPLVGVPTPAAATPTLDLFVAPVHLNLLGALVDTSPIHLTLTAQPGQGLLLGNLVTDLANLFNPPLPNTLNLDDINSRLAQLLVELNTQFPGLPNAPSGSTPLAPGQLLALTLPPINLNLLGLVLQTSAIQVNATGQTGNGDLLGNVVQVLLNTAGANPQNLGTLNGELNAILADVVFILNSATLTLPPNAVSSLTQVLQTLSLPNLINASGTASAPILNLSLAEPNGTKPPVQLDLLGLQVTTSNIQAQLLAQTGPGQILGNLLYNVANLLNPGGSLNLLSILNQLGL